MKRILYAILFVIFCTFTCISQNRTIKELDIEAQLIPIVYYNPTGFTNDILSSFHFNDSKPCYFIKKILTILISCIGMTAYTPMECHN